METLSADAVASRRQKRPSVWLSSNNTALIVDGVVPKGNELIVGTATAAAAEGTIDDDTSDNSRLLTRKLHQRCWAMFLLLTCAPLLLCATAAAFVVIREHRRNLLHPAARMYSLEYFLLSVMGGLLSGIPHVMITPFDVVKCRMQVGEATSVSHGVKLLWSEARQAASMQRVQDHLADLASPGDASSFSRRLRRVGRTIRLWIVTVSVVYKGWLPTLIGYCLQGAIKFGLYEYFKYRYASFLSYDTLLANITWVFLAASASAELFADVALAPWEKIKVRVQTSKSYGGAPPLKELLPHLWFAEGLRGMYSCLVPLWCRQVPYTMVKFTTFEQCAHFILYLMKKASSNQDGLHVAAVTPNLSSGERALVALLAGYLAGTLCAIVSQPADAVVSRISSSADGRTRTAAEAARELGWRGLWRGLSARVVMVGTLSGSQWAIYDGFKAATGVGAVH